MNQLPFTTGSGVQVAVILLLIVLTGTLSTEVFGDSFRCGRKVVRSGDSSSLLLELCGEPRSKDRAYEQVRTAEGRKKVRVERWHYKKSSRSLARAVLIYRGQIVAIETGGR